MCVSEDKKLTEEVAASLAPPLEEEKDACSFGPIQVILGRDAQPQAFLDFSMCTEEHLQRSSCQSKKATRASTVCSVNGYQRDERKLGAVELLYSSAQLSAREHGCAPRCESGLLVSKTPQGVARVSSRTKSEICQHPDTLHDSSHPHLDHKPSATPRRS